MGKSADVSVAFSADTTNFVNPIAKGRKELQGLKADIEKGASSLEALKKGLGEDSKFGAIFKILGGSGAVAGLSLAGNELNKLADKLEVVRKMNADGAGAGEIAEELAKSIPVFGSIFESGRKFRALIDGSADAAARMALETGAVNALTDSSLKRFERMRDTTSGLAGQLRKVRDELELIGKDAAARDDILGRHGKRDEEEEARRNLEAGRKQILEDSKAARDALAERENSLRSAQNSLAVASVANAVIGTPGVDYAKNAKADLAKAQADAAAIGQDRARLAARVNADLTAKEKEYRDTIAGIGQKADANKLERERAAAQAVTDTLKAAYQQRLDLAKDYDARLRDINDSRNEAKLRALGQDGKADLYRLFADAAKARNAAFAEADKAGIASPAILPQALAAAKKLADAITAQRDDAVKNGLIGGLKDRFNGLFGNDLSPAGSVGAFGGFLKAKLFGPGDKNYAPENPYTRSGLPTATERRFDFTLPGVDNPAAEIAKSSKQSAAELKAAQKKFAEMVALLRAMEKNRLIPVGIK